MRRWLLRPLCWIGIHDLIDPWWILKEGAGKDEFFPNDVLCVRCMNGWRSE